MRTRGRGPETGSAYVCTGPETGYARGAAVWPLETCPRLQAYNDQRNASIPFVCATLCASRAELRLGRFRLHSRSLNVNLGRGVSSACWLPRKQRLPTCPARMSSACSAHVQHMSLGLSATARTAQSGPIKEKVYFRRGKYGITLESDRYMY